MDVKTYLFFNGRCQEAVDFYHKAVGAKIEVAVRNKDTPAGPGSPAPDAMPAGWGDKILHMTFRIGETQVMASDGETPDADFSGFRLALTVADDAAAKRAYAALCEGGMAEMPLMETFFATSFGMLKDKFGIGWMVQAPKPM